jgi:hypothetical protein
MGLGDANTTPHGSVGVTTEPCEAIHDKTCIHAFALAPAASADRLVARFRARRVQRTTLTSRTAVDLLMLVREHCVRAPRMCAMASAEATQVTHEKAHTVQQQQPRVATRSGARRALTAATIRAQLVPARQKQAVNSLSSMQQG